MELKKKLQQLKIINEVYMNELWLKLESISHEIINEKDQAQNNEELGRYVAPLGVKLASIILDIIELENTMQ